MTNSPQIFVNDFHKIPGVTIKEKTRNFYQLLNKNRSLSDKDLDEICSIIQPHSHLEKIFYIDFLIKYKRSNELFTEFKKDDNITRSKISRHCWFFDDIFSQYEPEEFVNQLLPTMSVALRSKVLKRIEMKTSEKNNQFFDAIKTRYGLFVACVYLHKCSTSKIREIIHSNVITFTWNQLVYIYKKDKQLIEVYLKDLKEKPRSETEIDSFMKYLTKNDPNFYLKLINYKNVVRLGRRSTKKVYQTNESKILANPDVYIHLLNEAALVRSLKNKVVDFFSHFDITSIEYQSVVERFSQKNRFLIYKNIYARTHYNLDRFIETIPHSVLQTITNVDERETYLKQIELDTKNSDYKSYYSPETLYNAFIDEMNQTKPKQRIEAVKHLAKSCVTYKNIEVLRKLAKLVAERFKNDEIELHRTFIDALYILNKNKIAISINDDELWKSILDILALISTKYYTHYTEHVFHVQYLKYLWLKQVSFKEVLPKFANGYQHYNYEMYKDTPDLFKELILQFVVMKRPEELREQSINFEMYIINWCMQYNKKNPIGDFIDVLSYERLRNALFILFEGEHNIGAQETENLSYLIRLPKNEHITKLKILILENYKYLSSFDQKPFFYLLATEPELVVQHWNLSNWFDKYASKKPYTQVYPIIKKYQHLKLDKKIIDYNLANLEKNEFIKANENDLGTMVMALAILLKPGQYLDFTKKHLPTSDKVDLFDLDIRPEYKLQCYIAKNLKRLSIRTDELYSIILQFCRGDYTNAALTPLYRFVCQTPENEVETYLNDLYKIKALSVQKHVIYLNCIVYDQERVTSFFQNERKLPKLQPLLKYFIKSPTDQLFELVDKEVHALGSSSKHTFRDLIDSKVPVKYQARFFTSLWRVLIKCEEVQLQNDLLAKINSNIIGEFSQEFVNEVIQTKLFEKRMNAENFVILLLLHHYTDMSFNNFVEVFKRNKNNKKIISNFMHEFYKIYLNEKFISGDFLAKFKATFVTIFNDGKMFEEKIMLKLLDLKEANFKEIIKFVLQLNLDLVHENGELITSYFINTITKLLTPELVPSDKLIDFCYELAKSEEQIYKSLLLIHLLPEDGRLKLDDCKKYLEIMEKLRLIKAPVCQIALERYEGTVKVSY